MESLLNGPDSWFASPNGSPSAADLPTALLDMVFNGIQLCSDWSTRKGVAGPTGRTESTSFKGVIFDQLKI